MDALLNDVWLRDLEDAGRTIDAGSVAVSREAVRQAGEANGLDKNRIEKAAIAVSELATNQLRHARGGRIAVRGVRRSGVAGLEIIAADRGDGIADPDAALRGQGWTDASLGSGLAAIQRLADELDVDVRWGEGTCIRCRFFGPGAPRRREVGILSRPCEGEAMSGDHGVFVRSEEALLCAVVDGIGHGGLARDAANAAILAVMADPERDLEATIVHCDEQLVGTRGAVMSVGRLDEGGGVFDHAGVGNVLTRLELLHQSRSFIGNVGTLGAAGRRWTRARVEREPIGKEAVVIMFTDGLTSRATLKNEPELMRQHPIAIAQSLLGKFGRTTDDALILVAK